MKRKAYLLTLLTALFVLFASKNALSFQNPQLFKLKSKDPTERKLAVYYLAEEKDPKLVKTFCQMLLEDKSKDVRATVAERLGDFYTDNKEAENCLLKALKKEKNQAVIRNIVYAISNFSDKKAGKVLCSLLDSQDPEIRSTAIAGLIKFKGVCDKKLFSLLKRSKNPEEKVLIAKTLGIHQYKPAKQYMEKLLKSRKEENLIIALNFFKYYPAKEIAPKVEKILKNTENKQIEELAFDVLVISNNPLVYKTVKLYLLQPEFQKRFALRLPTFKTKLPPHILKLLLQSDNPTSRIAAFTYIGEHKLKNFCPEIEKNLFNKNMDVQSAAIWALGKTNCSNAVRLLCTIITNYDLSDDIRANAAQSLLYLPKETLKRNLKLIKKAYENEFLDDIKDTLLKAVKKATSS